MKLHNRVRFLENNKQNEVVCKLVGHDAILYRKGKMKCNRCHCRLKIEMNYEWSVNDPSAKPAKVV